MPYSTNGDLPEAVRTKYSDRCQTVFRDVWNEDFGKHHDEDRAFRVAHTAAGNCADATKSALKFVGPDTVEGLAIPWGSPDSRDLDGEFFTPATDLCLDWFGKSGRPALYDHGMDEDGVRTDTIGRQIDYETRDEGVWAQVQLGRNNRYRKAVDRLIEQGALGYSSGAMAHLATKSADGGITRWPWVELSLTPIPSHPATQVHYVKNAALIEHLVEAGADIPAPLVAAALKRLDDVPADDWTLKAGRVLSAATRQRLDAHPATLRGVADDLIELLDTSDAAKAVTDLDLELIRARFNGVSV